MSKSLIFSSEIIFIDIWRLFTCHTAQLYPFDCDQHGLNLNREAVVVAQLVERSLPTTEIWGTNLVVGIFNLIPTVLIKCIEKTKIEKKRPGRPNYKNFSITLVLSSTCTSKSTGVPRTCLMYAVEFTCPAPWAYNVTLVTSTYLHLQASSFVNIQLVLSW